MRLLDVAPICMPTRGELFGLSDGTELCAQCGHPDAAHLLHADVPYPTDGWVTCPVQDCGCRGTWSVDEASRSAMEFYREEYLREHARKSDDQHI